VALAPFIGVDTDHPDLEDPTVQINLDAVAVYDPDHLAEGQVVGDFRVEGRTGGLTDCTSRAGEDAGNQDGGADQSSTDFPTRFFRLLLR
jgi:hypothetical protein